MLAPEASISAHLYADKILDKAQVRASCPMAGEAYNEARQK